MSWEGETFVLDAVRDPQWPLEPHPDFAELRAEHPILRVRGWLPDGTPRWMWLLTRYDDVREFLASPYTSNAPAQFGDGQPGYFVMLDPPDHTRLRQLLTPLFTTQRINALRPRITRIVDKFLDAMAETGPPADLVTALAAPLPSLIICELLGVPFAERDDFERRSHELMAGNPEHKATIMAEMSAYMRALIARRRAEPGDDILSTLARSGANALTDDELVGVGMLLLTAGHATTTGMLASGVLLLFQHPDQLALVRDQPDVTDTAVEELLRYLTIESGGIPRLVTRDITVGGQPIRAGDLVRVLLPSANRDAVLVSDPDTLDVTREPSRHLAFGHGIHRCLGAPLARLELATAIPALLRRFPTLRPATPVSGLEFANAMVTKLPVTW